MLTGSATTILLIRHGQTDWNEGGRWQGVTDTHLSALGRAQGAQLAEYLTREEPKPTPITAVYSSDLMRAADTAKFLAVRLGLPIHLDPRWRELNMGSFQGLTYIEIGQRYPLEVREMETGDLDFLFPNGETRRSMQTRTHGALRDIAVAHPNTTVAVFTHGGTIRQLLRLLTGDDPIVKGRHIHNTSITTVAWAGSAFQLVNYPHTPHLRVNEKSGEF